MATNLAAVAKARKIEYFLISYIDLMGQLRAKLVPAAAIGKMQKTGAAFAGFATWLDMTPAFPDTFAVPDPDSLIQLPWKPEVGWLASDLWMDGKPVEASPRVALKRQIAAVAARGYRMKTGVECEFFLLNADCSAVSDELDTQTKPCYDQLALMRRYQLIREISDAMLGLGWNPYQSDHEDGSGQFEMNWEYDDCLVTADRHVFFKYMAKTIAEQHGFRATFMPKPFANLTGNGCHAHVSVWDPSGKKNLFMHKSDELGLSKLAYQFLGGIMHSADTFAALYVPTVNSFKRINAAVTTSGATWSPNAITYGGNNRTHMIRIPEPGRFELRLMDGASNPYLLQAGVLAAGLDGIEHKRDPGKPLDINMYTDGHKLKNVRKLPANLLDAVRLFDQSEMARSALGNEFVSSYSKLKLDEWQRYCKSVTPWERDNTLDC
jgi:glutamine synthetase type III